MTINKEYLIDIFNFAIKAADPYRAVMGKLRVAGDKIILPEEEYNLNGFRRIVVIGAGKAVSPMARAIEEIFEGKIEEGIIIVKYGHTGLLRKVRQIEASHPLPDFNGVRGTNEIMDVLKRADEKTLVICLVSGGVSSLLVSPIDDVGLENKRAVTDLLLKAGANIDELNAVRKHISNVKGGRMAELAYPATIYTMILSDVIGDRLDVIASGPTVPDPTTYKDAVEVIRKYGLEDRIPVRVVKILEGGEKGKHKETPKGGEEFFRKARTVILGGIKEAIDAAREKAEAMGFTVDIVTSELQGEAKEVAKDLAVRAIEARNDMKAGDKPLCLISGGETTVTVKGNGLGGRNQELALAFAIEIAGKRGITLLSAGTDGTDGPTEAAGAIVDSRTMSLAREYGLDAEFYLENNDSYHFFEKLDSLSRERHHLKTGPTGTNVMDLQIIMVDKHEN
ncbi:MAG: glycerate kinase [Nitrospirae bacterium]|nr:glycerate kinase [Nitrospirota bacterium]